jgi:AraC-like DNA-binding protein
VGKIVLPQNNGLEVPVVKAVLVGSFIQFMGNSGAPVDQLVSASGLSKELLAKPDSLCSMKKVTGFFNRFSQIYGSDTWGIDVGLATSYAEMGAYGAIVERCSTVYEYLSKGALFYSNMSNCEHFELVETENCARFYHRHASEIERPNLCGTFNAFVVIIRKCQEALGPDWYPRKIGLPTSVVDNEWLASSQIDDVSGENYIEFELNELDACFPTGQGAIGLLSKLGNSELDSMPSSITDIVAQHLSVSLETCAVSIQETALQLNVSVRTLQRKMADEGLTYRGFLNELRHQIAVDRLSLEEIPVSDLAKELGYKDPANFTRAFRTRSGISPRQFRAQHDAATCY